MARNIQAQCKQCRRIGEKLFLRGERCSSVKCAMVKRNYPPGMHGQKGRAKSSSYGLQMREKQKAKKIYGILEAQFKKIVKQAIKKAGNTALHLLHFLEMRLDNVVYRAGFANSRTQARQLVLHKNLQVNDRNVNIPAFVLKVGDKITVKEQKRKNKYFSELQKTITKKGGAQWLEIDKNNLNIGVLRQPEEEDITEKLQMNLIIEFYAR